MCVEDAAAFDPGPSATGPRSLLPHASHPSASLFLFFSRLCSSSSPSLGLCRREQTTAQLQSQLQPQNCLFISSAARIWLRGSLTEWERGEVGWCARSRREQGRPFVLDVQLW